MARRSGTGSSKLGHSTEVINSKVSVYEITAKRIAINQWPSGPSYSLLIYIYIHTYTFCIEPWLKDQQQNDLLLQKLRILSVTAEKVWTITHLQTKTLARKKKHKSNKAGKNSLRMWRVRISLWCGRDLINIWFISRHRLGLSAQLVVFLYNIYI